MGKSMVSCRFSLKTNPLIEWHPRARLWLPWPPTCRGNSQGAIQPGTKHLHQRLPPEALDAKVNSMTGKKLPHQRGFIWWHTYTQTYLSCTTLRSLKMVSFPKMHRKQAQQLLQNSWWRTCCGAAASLQLMLHQRLRWGEQWPHLQ